MELREIDLSTGRYKSYGSILENVYGSHREYLITFQKLSDTITNENRTQFVKNKQYALHRASKLRVISINHKLTNEEISVLKCGKITFIKGKILHSKYEDSDHLYSDGIKYYLSKDVAFHHHLIVYCKTYTGTNYFWQDCGLPWVKCEYVDGQCVNWSFFV